MRRWWDLFASSEIVCGLCDSFVWRLIAFRAAAGAFIVGIAIFGTCIHCIWQMCLVISVIANRVEAISSKVLHVTSISNEKWLEFGRQKYRMHQKEKFV